MSTGWIARSWWQLYLIHYGVLSTPQHYPASENRGVAVSDKEISNSFAEVWWTIRVVAEVDVSTGALKSGPMLNSLHSIAGGKRKGKKEKQSGSEDAIL